MAKKISKANLRRRGERLKRLAYELEALGADANYDGFGSDQLRGAANACASLGNRYLDRAES